MYLSIDSDEEKQLVMIYLVEELQIVRLSLCLEKASDNDGNDVFD